MSSKIKCKRKTNLSRTINFLLSLCRCCCSIVRVVVLPCFGFRNYVYVALVYRCRSGLCGVMKLCVFILMTIFSLVHCSLSYHQIGAGVRVCIVHSSYPVRNETWQGFIFQSVQRLVLGRTRTTTTAAKNDKNERGREKNTKQRNKNNNSAANTKNCKKLKR